ncbi:sensor histidine kinase [Clostridium folliculivorans]|uniref:histidine kinase n=1 Tax=Clostridium folliculivorans TaxID=2886038 RepID=A0A9W5Y3M3_9CLOT|nr:histidine kinase dimerization/phospho-acceptor domain-containing protein [Clostridium folliculivorans]GKU26036.1 two-component sensor histidine kinase [Clostridium folliculivorans]GKU28122.1 two-component sensor histidine kinase [Clostridium folliculivorans]
MGIRLKNKSKLIREILLILAMFSLATVIIVSVDVVTNKEVFEKGGFYKTKGFMEIVRTFNFEVVDLVKNYKNEEYIKSEEYAKNLSSDDVETKRQELVNKLHDETDKLTYEYNNRVNEANAKSTFDEADRLKEELNKGLQNLKEEYNSRINNTDSLKKDIINERLETLKDIRKRVDGFKNIKYVLIDGDDGTTKSNIQYDYNNIKASFKDTTGFYLKVYSKNGNTDPYENIYDCNVNIRRTNSGAGNFDALVNRVSNSNLTIYISVSEKLSEGDSIYFAYRDYCNLKVKVINEAIVIGVAFAIFIISLVMLIYNRKLLKENVISLKKLPLEVRAIGVIAILVLNIAILMSYYAYYPYRKSEVISFVEIEAIVGIALTLIMLLKLVLPIFYKEASRDMVKKVLLWKVYELLKKAVIYGEEVTYMRSIFFKAIVVICLGVVVILPLTVFVGFLFSHNIFVYGFIVLLLILTLAAFVSAYVFKKFIILEKIIVGVEKITNGDLNYTIDISGKGNLSKLADNINNMKIGLKSSIESEVKSERLKTELITNVSHDLKTPLTSIINYVDLLKRNNGSPEDMRNYIDILDRKSQRLKILIEDLFEASKAASGSLEVNMEKVEVTSLLKQTLAEFEEKIEKAELDFRVTYPEYKLYILADGKKLWRVFENLINNIINYSLHGTRVYILVDNYGSEVRISMKNISAYELDIDPAEILERFKRGDQARHTEGSGLGLAIAKSLVEIQNGSFNIEIDGDLFKANIEFEEFK